MLTRYPLGKFTWEVEGTVYRASLDGCRDEFCSIEGFGWVCLVDGPLEPDFEDPSEEDVAFLQKNHFVLLGDDRGFCQAWAFDTLPEAEEWFNRLADELYALEARPEGEEE